MANFSAFFPEDTPEAAGGQVLAVGELIHFDGNVYAANGPITLSDPPQTSDFETGFNLLSGVLDENNAGVQLAFWSGTRAEYDAEVAAGTIDTNTIYNITDESQAATVPIVTTATAAQTLAAGEFVRFGDDVYTALAAATLSDPVVATDFDTNFVLLSSLGVTTIGELTDVADTFGTTGQVLSVNAAADALEYVDVARAASDLTAGLLIDDIEIGNQNSATGIKFWSGTEAEYTALTTTRDQETVYYITDDN